MFQDPFTRERFTRYGNAAFLMFCFLVFFFPRPVLDAGRMDRIQFNDQELFISGANVAWIHFARDIGAGMADLDQFAGMFSELRANGGNTMRLWLHTDGRSTPHWDGSDVVGPGIGAIDDLRAILDLAHRHNVSLILCLWSFDMLRISHGQTVTDRAHAILTDPSKRQLYLDNALMPMVEALKGHPAILAWEIFNEAEGMSEEFGWDFNRHVPMSDIQAFVNQAAGTIKTVDPDAKVTTGAWSFLALSDIFEGGNARNYYRDDRLLDAGGHREGRLDFYTVHYYPWAGTELSPFHNDFGHWELDKPIVVAEFYARLDLFGVAPGDLYETLHERGYAGALAWQWVDHAQEREGNEGSWPWMLENMRTMREKDPDAVRLIYPETREAGLRRHLTFDDYPMIWAPEGAVLLDHAEPDDPVFLAAPEEERELVRFREPPGSPWTRSSVYFGDRTSRAELGRVSPGEGPFTIAFWFRVDEFEPENGAEGHILSSETGAAGSGGEGEWSVFLTGTPRDLAGGGVRLFLRQAEEPELAISDRITLGQWYHLALTRDENAAMNFRIHLDGELVYEGDNRSVFGDSEAGVFAGARPTDPASSGFVGWLDDLRIYSVALPHLGRLWGDGYALWADEVFGVRYGTAGTRPRDDYAGDGFRNFERYVFGVAPGNGVRGDAGALWVSAPDGGSPGVRMALRRDPSLDYVFETSSDLVAWEVWPFGFDGTNWSFLNGEAGVLVEEGVEGALSVLRAEPAGSGTFFRVKIPYPR